MWKAKLKNNQEVSEPDAKWNDIKDDVKELLLITSQNKIIYLPKNMSSYIHYKTGSCELGKNNIEIESRTIGFKIGNNIVKVRVNEKTGNINIEVE